jgi:predicted Fe-Mo cluster-binding NifX family protein
MKIGVTSQNFRTITGHAGRARRFMIFETAPDGQISLAEKHDLPKELCLHELPHDTAHVLDGVDVLITGGCGDGFVRKMAARGVQVVATGETDPMNAISTLLTGGQLAAALDHDDHELCECECGKEHSH